jgi:hypothetical protein
MLLALDLEAVRSTNGIPRAGRAPLGEPVSDVTKPTGFR